MSSAHPSPKSPTPQQKYLTFDDLSERAKIYVQQALDRHYLPASIARTIANLTHEKIAPVEIENFAQKYAATVQAEKNARDGAHYLVQRILLEGDDITEILHASFHEAFKKAKAEGAIENMNPLALEAAERRRQELGLRKEQVLIAERRVKVFEDRLRLDRKKGRAAIRRLEQKASRGAAITGKEVQRIRELYGINDSTDEKN